MPWRYVHGATFSAVGGGANALAEDDLRRRRGGAYRGFCRLRWPQTRGAPICLRCEGQEHYDLAARRRFKCRACHHQFSVTSGTIFASRKLAFVDLLDAIAVLVNGAKGVSALQLSRCTGLSYKTAFVLAHKIREALARETDGFCRERSRSMVPISEATFDRRMRGPIASTGASKLTARMTAAASSRFGNARVAR